MFDPIAYTLMDAFPLKWRFVEDATKWTVLPEADLVHFRPLTSASSRVLWRQVVTTAADHLTELDAAAFQPRIAEYRTRDDWTSVEESARVRGFLHGYIHADESCRVLFFWGASCAVDTTWDLLLRYWTDFCYPSDDSNVAILAEGDILVFYAEGVVWLARKREGG